MTLLTGSTHWYGALYVDMSSSNHQYRSASWVYLMGMSGIQLAILLRCTLLDISTANHFLPVRGRSFVISCLGWEFPHTSNVAAWIVPFCIVWGLVHWLDDLVVRALWYLLQHLFNLERKRSVSSCLWYNCKQLVNSIVKAFTAYYLTMRSGRNKTLRAKHRKNQLQCLAVAAWMSQHRLQRWRRCDLTWKRESG